MSLFAAVLLTAGFVTQSDALQVELATDRATYRVGEPVRLIYRVTNRGDEAIFLHPFLAPYFSGGHKTGKLLYCSGGADCKEFFAARPEDEYKMIIRDRAMLKPGQTMKSEFRVAFNPANSRLVLAEAGEVEFRWENESLSPTRDGPSTGRAVAVAPKIRVEAPDPEDTAALGEYVASGCVRVADFERLASSTIKDRDVKAAKAFLDRFPTTLYAGHVRAGLRRHLESQKISGMRELSTEEAEMLREVRGASPLE